MDAKKYLSSLGKLSHAWVGFEKTLDEIIGENGGWGSADERKKVFDACSSTFLEVGKEVDLSSSEALATYVNDLRMRLVLEIFTRELLIYRLTHGKE